MSFHTSAQYWGACSHRTVPLQSRETWKLWNWQTFSVAVVKVGTVAFSCSGIIILMELCLCPPDKWWVLSFVLVSINSCGKHLLICWIEVYSAGGLWLCRSVEEDWGHIKCVWVLTFFFRILTFSQTFEKKSQNSSTFFSCGLIIFHTARIILSRNSCLELNPHDDSSDSEPKKVRQLNN